MIPDHTTLPLERVEELLHRARQPAFIKCDRCNDAIAPRFFAGHFCTPVAS